MLDSNKSSLLFPIGHLSFLLNSGFLSFFSSQFFFLIKISKFFYKKLNDNLITLIFTKETIFKFFLKNLSKVLKSFLTVYLLKVKIRGLGYRMTSVSSCITQLFFVHKNFIYLHAPLKCIISARKKKLIFISCERWLIHELFTHIVLLKRSAIYRRMGFIYPRQLYIMKPRKKLFA